MPRPKRLRWLAALGPLVVAGGCFDTRIIPAEPSPGATGNATAGVSSVPLGGGGTFETAGGAAGGEAGPADGGAPEPNGAGITWLSLVGSRAPGAESRNAALGIDGMLYGYADDCATLKWDPETRCASGRLCTSGANFENWGIAVGFDFSVTGPDGLPPDSKLVWDPEPRGVRGIAWRAHGSAPGLQLWVLNMAAAFEGQCSQQSCEISGPPDGAAAASLEGTLWFDQMVKDYWGGRGVAYTYDSAAVYALQFKLPAVNVGSASFDFCIDALGVLR